MNRFEDVPRGPFDTVQHLQKKGKGAIEKITKNGNVFKTKFSRLKTNVNLQSK